MVDLLPGAVWVLEGEGIQQQAGCVGTDIRVGHLWVEEVPLHCSVSGGGGGGGTMATLLYFFLPMSQYKYYGSVSDKDHGNPSKVHCICSYMYMYQLLKLYIASILSSPMTT